MVVVGDAAEAAMPYIWTRSRSHGRTLGPEAEADDAGCVASFITRHGHHHASGHRCTTHHIELRLGIVRLFSCWALLVAAPLRVFPSSVLPAVRPRCTAWAMGPLTLPPASTTLTLTPTQPTSQPLSHPPSSLTHHTPLDSPLTPPPPHLSLPPPHLSPPHSQRRFKDALSKAKKQGTRFFDRLLGHRDSRPAKHIDDAEFPPSGGEDSDGDGPPHPHPPPPTYLPPHVPDSPSSRSTFLSSLPPLDSQLSSLLPATLTRLTFPPYFLFVDSSHPRGRRLLRWASSAPPSSSPPNAATLAVSSPSDVQLAFSTILSLYRRLFPPSSPPPPTLRFALAGSDALLNHLLPSYITALTSSPTLPLSIYPIPLHSPPCRVADALASIDNVYMTLFFSSTFRHALEGEESVEAEGGVVLDAIGRYVMDAGGEVRLAIGEAMVEGVAGAGGVGIGGPVGEERKERRRDGHPSSHSGVGSAAAPSPPSSLPHPPPVVIPTSADQQSAPALLSPPASHYSVSAPVHAQPDSSESESPTLPHPTPSSTSSTSTSSLPSRLTLPFISSVSLMSSTRPRTSSDSELHSPRHQAALPAARHHGHSYDQNAGGTLGGEEEEGKGERKEGGKERMKEKIGRFWVGMKEGLGDTAKHLRAPSAVQLPPAAALEGGKSGGKQGRTKRRNSDSQTHFNDDATLPRSASSASASASSSALPRDLLTAPTLGHSVQLHFWSNVSSKGKERVRRGSVDEGLGGLAAAASSGAVVPHVKKYLLKGSFEKVVVQRLLTAGSVASAGRDSSRAESKEQPKRSFISALTDRQHSHAGSTATDHSLAPAPHLAPSVSSPATALLPSSSPHHLSVLSSSHLLLLARKSPASQPSLLTRLSSSPSSLISRPITKLIASGGSREGPRWGVLVDGVELEGVSMVTVSPQVSGRVKALVVHSFTCAAKDERAV